MDYLLNFFDQHEHLRSAVRLFAADDSCAIGQAAAFEHPHAIELWQGDRLVWRFETGLRRAG